LLINKAINKKKRLLNYCLIEGISLAHIVYRFTTLFKHLANIRSEDYDSADLKITKIIFTYHIYTSDYKITDIDADLFLEDNRYYLSDD
jgi:hypothetical protein